MARRLKANVLVDGVLYRSGSTPPADVAKQITNPKAWGNPADESEPEAPEQVAEAELSSDDDAPGEDAGSADESKPARKVRRKGAN